MMHPSHASAQELIRPLGLFRKRAALLIRLPPACLSAPCCLRAQELIRPLGLFRKRAASLIRFSEEYLAKQVLGLISKCTLGLIS